jgi:hypothetical protein
MLYYALGGGLGHLTRACAVLYTLECATPAVILSSSPFIADTPVSAGVQIQSIPASFARDRHAYRAWLVRLLAELQPTVLYLDVFPAGIVGEFCDFPELDQVPIHYIARRLRWDAYAQQLRGRTSRFHATFVLEPLEEAHLEFINSCSVRVAPLSLIDPPRKLSIVENATLEKMAALAEPFWLIVHSGNQGEVRELVAYAEDLRHCEGSGARLVVNAPTLNVPALPVYAQSLGLFPAGTLFPFAERVISACGFNIMRQMSAFRQKHYYLPFARRFDDQYWRAAYWRDRNSGRARDIEIRDL